MKLEEFNKVGLDKAREELFRCCGCTNWSDKLMDHFPFQSIADMKILSDKIWFTSEEKDWLEAFSHHPKIGEKKMTDEKTAATKAWAEQEQSAVREATDTTLVDLALLNKSYFEKFGFIFIVCATGKSAHEMLEMLKERLTNDRAKELHIAANEQNKITHLRIDKLLS